MIQVKVAVVGDGTGRELLATGQETLQPVFVPTKVCRLCTAYSLSSQHRQQAHPRATDAEVVPVLGGRARGYRWLRNVQLRNVQLLHGPS